MTNELAAGVADALRQGRGDLAMRLLRRMLSLDPASAAAARDFSALSIHAHDLALAERTLARSIGAAPMEPMLWFNFAVAALRNGNAASAAWRCRTLLGLDPGSIDGHTFLGAALGSVDETAALAAFLRALALDPHAQDARLGVGTQLLDRNLPLASARQSRILLARAPSLAAGFGNLSIACWGADLRKDAAVHARRGLALDPTLAQAAWIIGQARLALGDYAGGLGLLEARWGLGEFRAVNGREFSWPAWRGGLRAGLRLLVWAEQGFGDALQFLRYVPILKAAGIRVVLEVQQPLRALVMSLGVEVVCRGELLPEVDAQVAMMSLPHLMGTRLETIPAEVPYLAAPPDRRARWRERLAAFPRPRIGLNWQGNPAFRRDRERSPGFEPIRPLLDAGRFLGLVRDRAPDASHPNLTHLGPDFADFADTAACLEQLDLVVTSDTAIAHLAGALARPTWLLLHHAPDWRWLEHRTDSPWYPTLRLFRQSTPGDWTSVVTQVADALRDLKP
jgi:tetratricopeptide (TPR) repeat protein